MTGGTTPATPSSGKTKVFITAAKKLATVDDAGLVSTLIGGGAAQQALPADPTGITSSTAAMQGIGTNMSITPLQTGRIHIVITGTIFNATAIADGAIAALRYGTGTAPANGAAATGTAASNPVRYVAATTAGKVPFALTAVVTGLTLGTAYWIDLTLGNITAGTATITDISATAIEF